MFQEKTDAIPMLNTLRARYRVLRRRGHNWLANHPRLWHWLFITGCLRGGAEAAARGVAVGLFIGLTPTVGIQTILMILCCIILGANFPVAFAMSWLSNPITMAPLYWGFHQLGKFLQGLAPFARNPLPDWMLDGTVAAMLFTFLGSLLVAVPFAVGGYLFSHWLHRFLLARRRARKARKDSGDSAI